jgi:preprotein translocase subunit YajC
MAAFLPLLILGLLMWVMLIRPQQQRVRRQQQLMSALEVGEEIITVGGIYGRIVALDDSDVTLEVAPGTNLRVIRAAVSRRLTTESTDAGASAFDALDDSAMGDERTGTPDTEIE